MADTYGDLGSKEQYLDLDRENLNLPQSPEDIQILESSPEIESEQPSTEGQIQETSGEGIRSMEQVYQDRIAEGRDPRRPGAIGTAQDILEGTGRNLYGNIAPVVGITDTIIDTLNLLEIGHSAKIPKLPKYESNATQALRNISGLVIPSLGLRSMAINAASKYHAAGSMAKKAPWLYSLGNKASFQFFAKAGIDIGTGGLTDFVAEQNQRDDNFLGTLKHYWPKTFQWIPNSIATNVDDTAGERRAKNVNEGAIFSVLASVVEGAAYLTGAGRSIKRTSKLIPSKEGGVKNLEELGKDQFTDIVFDPDNPIQDTVLRNYARKEYELELLNKYYGGSINYDLYSEGETLVRTKDPGGILKAKSLEAQIQNPEFGSGWGRIGNLINEATRKEGIELENLSNRTLVAELTDQLKKGGKFSERLKSNKLVTAKMMDEAGKKLAATLLHPRVDTDDILGILEEFKKAVDESAIRIVGKKGISGAIKGLKEQMLDLDVHKARAYLVTSEGGQIADMSEGARLMEGGDSVRRTIDLMADRLEVLMVEKGLANFEANSMFSNMRAWQ